MNLVIFDCDGTIVDSQHMIVAAMDQAFAEARLPPPRREAVLSVVGLSLPLAITRLLPSHDAKLVHRLTETYKSAFGDLRKVPAQREPLYPGMRNAIITLAARPDTVLGIATGKSRRGVAELLEREGLAGHFITVQTADTHPSKPHPSMVLEAMADARARADACVMIGDTTFDVEMGRAASVHTIGVAWGYHSVGELQRVGANAIADACEALPLIVSRLLDRQSEPA